MTVIAYKAGIIAADTGFCLDWSLIGGRMKIARRKRDGALVGGAGNSGWCDAFRRWVVGGGREPYPPISGESSLALVAFSDRSVMFFENGGSYIIKAPTYVAIGSGQDYALGAMHAGADAVEAVRAAIKHCPTCDGDVVSLSHKSGKVTTWKAT